MSAADAPAVVAQRGRALLGFAAVNLVITTALLWWLTYTTTEDGGLILLAILLSVPTSALGFYYLMAGWGVRHGALWALRWLPRHARDDPDVHAYFWGDELCPGCAVPEKPGVAFCAACGHPWNPPALTWWAATKLALARAFKKQPPEPPRTAAYRTRTPHETTDRYLVVGLAVIAVGWLGSNTLASFAEIGVTIGVIVPAFLMLFWLQRQDRYEREPTNLLLIAFGWGMFCGVLVLPLNSLVVGLTGYAQIAGFTEEVTKAAIVVLFAAHRTIRKEINGPTDGLIYAGAAGLGFAAMENFSYVLDIWMITGDLAAGFALRAVGILNHMMYAGITGSFLGLMLLRNGRVGPKELLAGLVPGGLIHALNNSMDIFGVAGLVLLFVPTALAAWVFFKLLAESLRDEAAWGYGSGRAPVEEHA